ncbi:hypothetical protein B0O99DRAFT_592604 [Bisporella sp. PMI_857]|nr:hypothetical protein B0O99DRAFT_592604 [Bisporella sp. PMI_857]
MAPPAPITLSAELVKRFETIVAMDPPLDDAGLQRSLAQPPAVDKTLFHRWHIAHLADEAERILSTPLNPPTDLLTTLRNITYDDPPTYSTFLFSRSFQQSLPPLPLGNFTPAAGKKTYCFLRFSHSSLLPADYLRDRTYPNTSLTYAKYPPVEPTKPIPGLSTLPVFFLQLGQLVISGTATPPDESIPATEFVIVVSLTRQVFLLWNPEGPYAEPELVLPEDIDANAYKKRDTSGPFPGFKEPCTALLLAANINDLLTTDQIEKPLTNVSTAGFVVLPSGTVQFGGVSAEGWTKLINVSQLKNPKRVAA